MEEIKFKNWETKILNDFKNRNFSKKTLKTKEIKLFVMYIFLTVLIFLASVSTMIGLIITVFQKQPINVIALGFAIGSPNVFMLCAMIFSGIKASKNYKLWWKKMSQLLDFQEYYQLAINEITNGNIKLIDISEKFKVAPWWPLNKKNFSYLNNDKILNMIYDENIVISFGTVLIPEGSGRYQINYSYLYLACEFLHKSFNKDNTIKKSNIFNKVIDNTDLESTVFEKMYNVRSNDQIEIRKLLTPKVIENLMLMTRNYNISEMTFKDKYLTFCLAKQQLSLTNKGDNKLICFNFKTNPEDWAIELINTIKHDLNLLLCALEWLLCFD